MKFYVFLSSVITLVVSQQQQYTTPTPILKQINKHNEDGSYSYGYEAADGTFKIESKYPNGEVFGKYGYIDDQGKLRQIEYGASRRGFEPAGNDVSVPPPTLVSNYPAAKPLGPNQEDDGQYREDPSVYYKNDKYNTQPQQQTYSPSPRYTKPTYEPNYEDSNNNYQQPTYRPSFQQSSFQQSSFQQPNYQKPSFQQDDFNQPAFRPQSQFNFNSFPQSQPQRSYYSPSPPAYPNYNQFAGAPATNVDISSGSYSVNYK